MDRKYRHKICGLIMTLIIAASASGQKIMDLPAYTGNPAGAYTAISIGNATRRYDLGTFLRSIDTTGKYQPKGNYLTAESDPKRVTSVTITGTTTKTVTLTLADGSVVSGSFAAPVATETDPLWTADKANYYNKAQVDAALGSSSGGVAGVSSFNSRTGVVVPQLSDYASYYAAISHQHDTITPVTGYATKGYALNLANGKVDKVQGRQLTTEDYTTAEKAKLAAISGTNTGDQNLSGYLQRTDSTQYSTKANVTKVRDSLQANINAINTSVSALPTASSPTTMTNKNLTSPTNTFPTFNQSTTGTASTITGSISEAQVTNLATDLAARKSAADSAHNIPAAYVRQDRMKNYIDSLSSRSVYGGTFSITGDGSTVSFTVPVSGIPILGPDAKVFITSRSSMGAAFDSADLSTESITLNYLTAPTPGTKTINYFIVP